MRVVTYWVDPYLLLALLMCIAMRGQIGTLQAELEETDNELERSVEAHAKWYRKPVDDSGLSAAQKARFSAEVVAPLVKEADSLRLRSWFDFVP